MPDFSLIGRQPGYVDFLSGQNAAIQQQQATRQNQMQEQKFAQEQAQIKARQTAAGQLGSGDYTGASRTALGAGDLDLATHIQAMSKEQQAQTAAHADTVAAVGLQLKQLPAEKRGEAFQAAIPSLKAHGVTDAELQQAAQNLTDQGLDGYISSSLTVKDAIAKQQKEQDYALNLDKFDEDKRRNQAGEGLTARSQDITVRGQNLTDARGRDSNAIARANLGLRAQEVAQSASGGLTPKQRTQTEIQTRKEFDGLQDVKNYKAAIPIITSAARAPNTAAGDVDLIYAVGKLFDPTSVVREGEMKLALQTGSVVSRIVGQSNVALNGGARLAPETRKRLLETLANRTAAYAGAYNQARENYSKYASDYGLAPDRVVGQHPGDQLVKAGLARRSGSGLSNSPQPDAGLPQGWSITRVK